MKFGVQPAFCSADTAGNAPFLSRLAAVRWALRCVASIWSCSGTPPSAASPANILSNTPIRLHRTKRLYKVFAGPYSAGASRHCRPRLITWIIPEITGRPSTRGAPYDKEKQDPNFPAFVVHWTDYSQGRKDPLKREVRLAPDEKIALQIGLEMEEGKSNRKILIIYLSLVR